MSLRPHKAAWQTGQQRSDKTTKSQKLDIRPSFRPSNAHLFTKMSLLKNWVHCKVYPTCVSSKFASFSTQKSALNWIWWFDWARHPPTPTLYERPFSSGVVTSSNHPGEYPNNLQRSQWIKVEQGLIMSLKFTSFNIQFSDACRDDYLTITDSDGTTLMEKSCGSSLPANITSATNAIELIFSSDHFDSGNSGWSANWSAVTPGGGQQSFDCFSLLESNHW